MIKIVLNTVKTAALAVVALKTVEITTEIFDRVKTTVEKNIKHNKEKRNG